MDQYIKRADIMQGLTSAEMQKKLKAMTGEEVYNEVLSLVNSIPAADVAPVVYCAECKHYGWEQEPSHGKTVRFCKHPKGLKEIRKDTSCSYGERRGVEQ